MSSGKTRLLVDVGLSRRELFKRLSEIGEDPEAMDGILVTHEHSDHVCGLARVARTLKAPIYISEQTAASIDWQGWEPRLEMFRAGSSFQAGDIEVSSFTIPHDAIDPVGFCLKAGGVKVSVATDLGYIPDSIKFHLRGSDLVLLEANHDLEMLKVGPYPWSVKQRVMGRRGHLSNEVVSEFLRHDLDAGTHTVILGHLSEHNNHPEIVRLMASEALESRRLGTRLIVAEPRQRGEVIEF